MELTESEAKRLNFVKQDLLDLSAMLTRASNNMPDFEGGKEYDREMYANTCNALLNAARIIRANKSILMRYKTER